MADINLNTDRQSGNGRPKVTGEDGSAPFDMSEDRLVEYSELLFFAYRDFIAEPDEILSEFGFGRAHHRVLHFVNRHPGLRVADLLDILKITKQSLARVLKQLVDEGYIIQQAGDEDRRERLLRLSPKGAELADRLATLQADRIRRALREAGEQNKDGSQAKDIVRLFLYNMIKSAEQPYVAQLLALERQPRLRARRAAVVSPGNKSTAEPKT